MINFTKLMASFKNAGRGLIYLLKYEQNFKLHLIFGILALILSLILSVSYIELIIILIIISFVFMAEIVNTVIENILDVIHPDYHQKIGILKDATAGVVLFAAIVAVIIGLMIFIPKII